MAKNILTIGVELASEDARYEGFKSKVSLLDWDIILFTPVIDDFVSYSARYQGKPNLGESESFLLKECCEHWRREIKEAFDAGKTIIVFLSSLQEVYIDTGERKFSGTGRNQKTTVIVAPYSNYKCLPLASQPLNAQGAAIKLTARGAEVLASYWSEFADVSEYQVILSASNEPACLVTRTGEKTVGAIYSSKNSSGSLVLLPAINFYPDHFTKEEGQKAVWAPAAFKFAARMLNAIIALDKALRSSGEITPAPSWAADPAYALANERRLQVELLTAERQVEEAQKQKEDLLERLRSAGRLRGLLFEKGKTLESIIIDALVIIGFKAEPYRDASSEFDVVFESAEGRLIGEAEGKDNKAVSVDKLRQLMMNIHEDLQREEVTTPAKGVLFGNGYRLLPVQDRETAFTEKCISAARMSSTALVATADLFRVARYLSDQPDEGFAKQCRESILGAIGCASLPEPPQEEQATPSDVQNGA